MTENVRNLPKRSDPILRVVPGPSDINSNGHIFGGWVLSQMDIAGGIVAARVAQGATATVAIEAMQFIAPIELRDIISVYAHVERRGRSSMGIRIEVAGVVFYHQGSADLLDDEIPSGVVDYFLCGIAGRSFTRDYAERILRKLSPRIVVPTHYDNFFRELAAPLDFSLNVNLARFPDEVRRVSTEFTICTLPLAQPLTRQG